MIRNWTSERIPELASLWEALELHHAGLDDVPPVRAVEESWSRRQGQYCEWLADGSSQLLVFERDGGPAGYLMLRIGGPMTTWDTGDRVATVETLSVLESERSTGVGQALMDAALVAADGAGAQTVYVDVAYSNAGAIRFYERNGFKPFYVQLLRYQS